MSKGSDINLEELIRQLELAKKEAESRKSKRKRGESKEEPTTLAFINDSGVEAGEDAVPNYVIYYHYKGLWEACPEKGKTNKTVFFRTF